MLPKHSRAPRCLGFRYLPSHFHTPTPTIEAPLKTVQRRARRVLRGGPGGEIPPHVAPEQRLRGAFLAHVIPPEALLRGYTRGKHRPGTSPPCLISIPPSLIRHLCTVLRSCSRATYRGNTNLRRHRRS